MYYIWEFFKSLDLHSQSYLKKFPTARRARFFGINNLSSKVKMASGQCIKLDWSRVRVFDRDVANMFHNIVKGCEIAT